MRHKSPDMAVDDGLQLERAGWACERAPRGNVCGDSPRAAGADAARLGQGRDTSRGAHRSAPGGAGNRRLADHRRRGWCIVVIAVVYPHRLPSAGGDGTKATANPLEVRQLVATFQCTSSNPGAPSAVKVTAGQEVVQLGQRRLRGRRQGDRQRRAATKVTEAKAGSDCTVTFQSTSKYGAIVDKASVANNGYARALVGGGYILDLRALLYPPAKSAKLNVVFTATNQGACDKVAQRAPADLTAPSMHRCLAERTPPPGLRLWRSPNEARYGELDAAAGDGDFGAILARAARGVLAALDAAEPDAVATPTCCWRPRMPSRPWAARPGRLWGTGLLRAADAHRARARGGRASRGRRHRRGGRGTGRRPDPAGRPAARPRRPWNPVRRRVAAAARRGARRRRSWPRDADGPATCRAAGSDTSTRARRPSRTSSRRCCPDAPRGSGRRDRRGATAGRGEPRPYRRRPRPARGRRDRRAWSRASGRPAAGLVPIRGSWPAPTSPAPGWWRSSRAAARATSRCTPG